MEKRIRNQKLIDKVVLILKEVRKKKGLSQEDVFNDTGIHISRIETGSVNVTISTLDFLASYFDISLEEFFNKVSNCKDL